MNSTVSRAQWWRIYKPVACYQTIGTHWRYGGREGRVAAGDRTTWMTTAGSTRSARPTRAGKGSRRESAERTGGLLSRPGDCVVVLPASDEQMAAAEAEGDLSPLV